MALLEVPVIDIAAAAGPPAQRRDVARRVDEACSDIGFLVISGHGIAPSLMTEVSAVSRAFFDLPLEEKMTVLRPAPDVTRGYIPLEAESVARSQGDASAPGDLNESLMIGPVDAADDAYHRGPAAGRHFHANLWPRQPAGLEAAYTTYYRAMSSLAATLMRLFALGLDLPESFFDDKIDRHISRLRVRNYPAPETPPKPGQLRVGPHADYGSLTILKTEDVPGGLQVRNKAGQWVAVPILPDTFVVNLGELMARWTNDRWRATLHRVVNPPPALAALSRRQSLVFFHNPNYDAEIACLPSCRDARTPPRYPPTTSGEHLRGQFVRTQAY
ncbi:MAG: isopenicillin N synthase family dioxygenase [Stellaceae bacterium]